LFSIKNLQEKAQLISQGLYQADEKIYKVGITKLDLFKQFKKFDRNNNGFLEIEEYIECLTKGEARLDMKEIISLALLADINGDRRIDYEELMLHFHEIMRQIRYQDELQKLYMKFKAEGGMPVQKKVINQGGGTLQNKEP